MPADPTYANIYAHMNFNASGTVFEPEPYCFSKVVALTPVIIFDPGFLLYNSYGSIVPISEGQRLACIETLVEAAQQLPCD